MVEANSGIISFAIATAPTSDDALYDSIYSERYLGSLKDNKAAWEKAAVRNATGFKNLAGSILIQHGTGDDNVHYQNAELLINELIKNNKVFSLMSYPNRTHSISEGEGTSRHVATMFTDFIRKNCPGGGR